MCVVSGDKHEGAEQGDWGLTSGLCKRHYDLIVAQCTTDRSKKAVVVDAAYLSDYVGIKAMMFEMTTVMKQLKALNEQLEAAIDIQKKTKDDLDERFKTSRWERKYVRMSRVLEYFEGYNWFPSSHRIFVDGLSGPDFFWYLSHGFMVKDPGPNIMHGDFTHRLQWHAIMRHITDNFTRPHRPGWNHTPLDLYTSLGKAPAKDTNVWGKALDRDGASPPDISPNSFCNPNDLHKALRDADYGLLTRNIVRRFKKRAGELELATQYLEKWKSKLPKPELEQMIMDGTGPEASDVAGVLYAWRKNGGRPLGIPLDAGPKPVKGGSEASLAYFEREKAWKDKVKKAYAARVAEFIWKHDINEGEVEKLAYKKEQPHYDFIITPESKAGFHVLAEVDGKGDFTSVSDDDIDDRVKRSYGGFDPRYEYGEKIGAKPRGS